MAAVILRSNGQNLWAQAIRAASTRLPREKIITISPTNEVVHRIAGGFPTKIFQHGEAVFNFASVRDASINAGTIGQYALKGMLAVPRVRDVYERRVPGAIFISSTLQELEQGEWPKTANWYPGKNKPHLEEITGWQMPRSCSEIYVVHLTDSLEDNDHKVCISSPVTLVAKDDDIEDLDTQIAKLNGRIKTCQIRDGDVVRMTDTSVYKEIPASRTYYRYEMRVMVVDQVVAAILYAGNNYPRVVYGE